MLKENLPLDLDIPFENIKHQCLLPPVKRHVMTLNGVEFRSDISVGKDGYYSWMVDDRLVMDNEVAGKIEEKFQRETNGKVFIIEPYNPFKK